MVAVVSVSDIHEILFPILLQEVMEPWLTGLSRPNDLHLVTESPEAKVASDRTIINRGLLQAILIRLFFNGL